MNSESLKISTPRLKFIFIYFFKAQPTTKRETSLLYMGSYPPVPATTRARLA